MQAQSRQVGFTLVEMITVIVVTGILAAVVWRNISRPIEGFEDVTRRARLVDVAETALNRMTREIRLALPNSVRVNGNGRAIEILRTLTGGRYRARPDGSNNDVCPAPGDDTLDFTASRDCFQVLGPLPNATRIVAGGGGRAACMAGSIDCLAIYNTGQAGADAYGGDNLAGVSAVSSGAGGTAVTFDRSDAGTPFPLQSPNQRFQIVDTPVSFVCDLSAKRVDRYDNYAISAAMVVPPGGTARPVATQVTACSFSYVPGTATRAGLVTLTLTVSDQSVVSGQAESVSLLQQVHIANAP
jgi:MSHA biogenesis protein MshO